MPEDISMPRQLRAIFFVFDGGTGLGHLRRLSCIAKALQGRFSCLVVTSHRAAAAWFVPAECEYVHIPAWDSLVEEKAAYWGRQPFLSVSFEQALNFRQKILHGIVDAFQPDMIFVDHLPLGMNEELGPIVEAGPYKKYLVTRGVQNETEDLARLLFHGRAKNAIERHYDRVFMAIDGRVFDFAKRYPDFVEFRAKQCPVGYVTERIDHASIASRRRARGLAPDTLWAVASAGGGQHGEALIAACCSLANANPGIQFDIVIGPRSGLAREDLEKNVAAAANLKLHDEVADMPQLHAAADIVITSGGYNSLLEALQGNAKILCIPNRKSERDEQYVHAAHLQKFASIDLDINVAQLPAMFERAVLALRSGPNTDRRFELDFGGALKIRDKVLEDTEATLT